MKNIIQKAEKGGYEFETVLGKIVWDEKELVCDPLFWKSLGKACGWIKSCDDCGRTEYNNENCVAGGYHDTHSWLDPAIKFHSINLTQSWSDAINYLSELIKG